QQKNHRSNKDPIRSGMIHQILNHRVKHVHHQALNDLPQRFGINCFKVKKMEDSVSICPVLDIETPASLNTTLLLKEIKLSKQGADLVMELIPNNIFIFVLYTFVLLMGVREGLSSGNLLASADIVLATTLLF